MLSPWAHSKERVSPKRQREFAERLALAGGYRAAKASALYVQSGTLLDWVASTRPNALVATVETFGSDDMPDGSYFTDEAYERVARRALAMLDTASGIPSRDSASSSA